MPINENELINNYNHNLELFKKYIPDMYEKLIREENNIYALEIMDNELNISKNGLLIYPQGGVINYFNELLSSYYDRGKKNIVKYTTTETLYDDSFKQFGTSSIQLKYQHLILNNYQDSFNQFPVYNQPKHDFVYSMMIFGIGLGYHIPEIIKKYNIKHIILADVDIEMLRASLYTLNWAEILSYIYEENKFRSLSIMIEEESSHIYNKLSSYLLNYLPLAGYNMWQFISYSDPVFTKNIQSIAKNIEIYQGARRGFFDDEKWSFQHTLENLKQNIPLLTNTSDKVDKGWQVFIIANGPSLDKYINIIQENQEKVIIIAAGSALRSLYAYGIKADFLIQVERHYYASDATLQYAPDEYLKDVNLIAMNTVHPRMFSIFDKKYMYCKMRDAGTEYIGNKEKYPSIQFTNPSVSNAALSLAIFFGFKNISLFGMDFGYKSTDAHHSKNSFYYDKDSNFYDSKWSKELQVEGQNGDIIYTETFYNDSRKNIEELLKVFKKDNHLKVYNYSDGAKIDGTIVGNVDTSSLVTIDKSIVLKTIKKQFSVYTNNNDSFDKEKIFTKIDELKKMLQDNITLDISLLRFLVIQDYFHTNYKSIFKNEKYMLRMLDGTIFLLMSKIYIYLSSHKESSKTSNFIIESLNLVCQCLDEIKQSLELIDTTMDIFEKQF